MATGQPAMQSNGSADRPILRKSSSANWLPAQLDRAVGWLKWPSAVLAILITPLIAWALARLAFQIIKNPTFSLLPFLCGAAGFWMIWSRWLGNSRIGSFLVTLEHELTHALFALLTLHRIVGFRASLRTGGHVRFAGKGNWLIVSAPYFFPSAAIVLFTLAYFLPFASLPWQSLLLGVALTYHLVSTWRETHRDQYDLRLLGKTFCWMFLPAANLAAIGLLVSFAHLGTDGIRDWLLGIRQPLDLALKYVFWSEQ